MNDISLITRHFDNFIDDTFKEKPHLITVFKNHERKNLCIKNIQKELAEPKYQLLIHDIKEFKDCINTFAQMFCFTVINEKEKSIKKRGHALLDEFGNPIKKKAHQESEPDLPEGVLEVERHSNP